ncbi:SIGLEC family-like protein 1, partial [Pteropus vampyrus]|uniref:SIGLEC family-like protein 1 n=1 Tax=Pteropus vampyrus TaxID=132908 RepID=A0A6P3RPK5_PTEVA
MGKACAPPILFYSSCSFGKILQCNCSFYGIPTPTVQWLMKGVPVNVNNMDNVLQMTSIMRAPWNNSTIVLLGKPEIVMSLLCEGRNQYGIHASSIFLIPDKSAVSKMFMKGLIQGIVYGSTASSLLFFFLVLCA